MSAKKKYLYRVQGEMPDGTVKVRHYQTRRAADNIAKAWSTETLTHRGNDEEYYTAILPQLVNIMITRSAPIEWPEVTA